MITPKYNPLLDYETENTKTQAKINEFNNKILDVFDSIINNTKDICNLNDNIIKNAKNIYNNNNKLRR